MAIDQVISANMAAMEATKSGGPIGKRLMPQIIDAYADHEPERVWAAQALTDDIADGFRNVTFKELSHCVNATAWMLERSVGRSKNFETLSYIGVSDLRYCVFVWAAVKCGYQTLLPSTRNSESGNLSLMHNCNITKFFCSKEWLPAYEVLKQNKPDLQSYVVPSMDDMLATSTEHYAYDKTFEEAKDDPIICCHTSGSTGAPKPIMLTNHYFAAYDNHRKIHRVEGRGRNVDYATFDTADNSYYYNTFPPFHIAGIIAQAMIPILYKTTVLLGPVNRPPTGEICNEILKAKKIHSIYTPPTVLEQLITEPGGLERAGKLNFIIFSGGPLAPSAGDQIAKVVDLGQYIGSTEIGIIPGILPRPETWRYFEFHPVFGCQLEHIAQDEYELVVPHDASLDWIRPAPYRIAPDRWRTKDLFKQHAQDPNAYRFHGRADDIIVLGNGEKFNPVTMEAIIQGSPYLSGAVIVGQARFQPALLVEPKIDTTPGQAQRQLIENIWPSVQKANADGPAHAQIFKSMVLVTSPDKPLIRAGKGTVVRGKSSVAYEDEIEEAYSDKGRDPSTVDQTLPALDQPLSADKIAVFICSYLNGSLNGEMGAEDDIFVRGVDSLQTLQVVNALKVRLRPFVHDLGFLNPKAVYHHPTPYGLATYCMRYLGGDAAHSSNGGAVVSREESMASLVSKYTADLPDRSSKTTRRDSGRGNVNNSGTASITVALTGSTGTLGTNILQVLLEDPGISKVHCLDRSSNAIDRHYESFARMGLLRLLESDRVSFRRVSFGNPTFGLERAEYEDLLGEVDVVIHNAWKVDFNVQLGSFEPEHIRSVYNLAQWSLCSPRHTRIVFVSSLASVSRWPMYYDSVVPEATVEDFRVARELGYGESKHVAERILQAANMRSGVPATVLRVGQIAGSTQEDGTVWRKAEWLPSLVHTSMALGCAPRSLPAPIDWIPVDLLARSIVDIVQAAAGHDDMQVFNICNPCETTWEALVPALQKSRAPDSPLRLIDFDAWNRLLHRVDMTNADELEQMPAAKIKDFYESMEGDDAPEGQKQKGLRVAMDELLRMSETAQHFSAVDEKMMGVWLRQWGYSEP